MGQSEVNNITSRLRATADRARGNRRRNTWAHYVRFAAFGRYGQGHSIIGDVIASAAWQSR